MVGNKVYSVDEVRAFFDAHFTVRKYKEFEMPADHVDVILHAAQRAPTDATAQMYSFIRLEDRDLRQKIAAHTTNAHVATASLAFVVCADVHRLNSLLELDEKRLGDLPAIANHFGIGDAVMAGQNLLLASEMLGYRGCWIGGVLNALDEIVALTKLPVGVIPFAALTIGVPDEPPVRRPRLPRSIVFHTDAYREPSRAELEAAAHDMASVTARGNWPGTLSRYFAAGGTMEMREPKLKSLIRRQLEKRE